MKHFEIMRGIPSEDLLGGRLHFVREMKWFSDQYDDDQDRYDVHEDTYHFVRRDAYGSILASLRLTLVGGIDESLSYEMVAKYPEFQSVVGDCLEIVSTGAVWDLTRMIFRHSDGPNSMAVRSALVELFGMAARVSAGQVECPENGVYWIFTTTPWTLRFFRQTGIESRTFAAGRIPDIDAKPRTTFFCVVDVASAIEALRISEKHQDTYQCLRRGATAIESTAFGHMIST